MSQLLNSICHVLCIASAWRVTPMYYHHAWIMDKVTPVYCPHACCHWKINNPLSTLNIHLHNTKHMIQILMAHVLRRVTETNNSWQRIQLRIFTSKINFISQRQQFNSYKKVICIKKGHQKIKEKWRRYQCVKDIQEIYIYIYIYIYENWTSKWFINKYR